MNAGKQFMQPGQEHFPNEWENANETTRTLLNGLARWKIAAQANQAKTEAEQGILPGTSTPQENTNATYCGDCSVPMDNKVKLRKGKAPVYYRQCPRCKVRWDG